MGGVPRSANPSVNPLGDTASDAAVGVDPPQTAEEDGGGEWVQQWDAKSRTFAYLNMKTQEMRYGEHNKPAKFTPDAHMARTLKRRASERVVSRRLVEVAAEA